MDFLSIDAWQLWVIVGVLFLIAEIMGTEFILLAIGSALIVTGLVTEAFDLGINMQIVMAGASAAVFVPVFFYSYRRFFKARGSARLLSEGMGRNETYEVVEYGDRLGIRVQGDFFPARISDGTALQSGERVRLTSMRGLTACVEREPSQS